MEAVPEKSVSSRQISFDAALLRVAHYLAGAAYLSDRGLLRPAQRLWNRAETFARESGYTELLLLVWSHEPAPAGLTY